MADEASCDRKTGVSLIKDIQALCRIIVRGNGYFSLVGAHYSRDIVLIELIIGTDLAAAAEGDLS